MSPDDTTNGGGYLPPTPLLRIRSNVDSSVRLDYTSGNSPSHGHSSSARNPLGFDNACLGDCPRNVHQGGIPAGYLLRCWLIAIPHDLAAAIDGMWPA